MKWVLTTNVTPIPMRTSGKTFFIVEFSRQNKNLRRVVAQMAPLFLHRLHPVAYDFKCDNKHLLRFSIL